MANKTFYSYQGTYHNIDLLSQEQKDEIVVHALKKYEQSFGCDKFIEKMLVTSQTEDPHVIEQKVLNALRKQGSLCLIDILGEDLAKKFSLISEK